MRLLDSKAFECLIMALWNIWNSRNNFVFCNLDEDPKIIWDRAVAFCQEFRLHNLSLPPMLPKPTRDKKWSKPPPGTIKINIDAAWDNGKAGIGILGRHNDGFVVGGSIVFKEILLMPAGLKPRL